MTSQTAVDQSIGQTLAKASAERQRMAFVFRIALQDARRMPHDPCTRAPQYGRPVRSDEPNECEIENDLKKNFNCPPLIGFGSGRHMAAGNAARCRPYILYCTENVPC